MLQGMAEVKAYHLTGLKSRELNDAIAANAKVNTDMEMTLIPRMTVQNFIAKLTGVCMVAFSCAFYCADTMDALTAVVMVISAFIVYASLETAGNYSALLRVVDVSVEPGDSRYAADGHHRGRYKARSTGHPCGRGGVLL